MVNKRNTAGLFAVLAGLGAGIATTAVPLPAQDAKMPSAKPAAAGAEIDKPFKDVTLRDLMSDNKNAAVKLSQFKGKKAVVLVFMANRCSVTWNYEKPIGQLLQDYGKKDVAIMAVHSNYQEPDTEIKGQMEQRNLAMPVLDDKKTQAFADYVGARTTPTFLVIDKEGVLRYRGAFDKRGDAKVAYLRPALDAVLAGKEVPVKSTRAFG